VGMPVSPPPMKNIWVCVLVLSACGAKGEKGDTGAGGATGVNGTNGIAGVNADATRRRLLVSSNDDATVAGAALVAALASITASDGWEIVLDPGKYDIGHTPLALKAGLTITGSNTTIVSTAATAPAFSATVGSVFVQNVVFECSGPVTPCLDMTAATTAANLVLDNSSVLRLSSTSGRAVALGTNGSLVLRNYSEVRAEGTGDDIGVAVSGTGYLYVESHSTVGAVQSLGEADAIFASDAAIVQIDDNAYIQAQVSEGASGLGVSILSTSTGALSISDSSLSATSRTLETSGATQVRADRTDFAGAIVVNGSAGIVLKDSTFSATGNWISVSGGAAVTVTRGEILHGTCTVAQDSTLVLFSTFTGSGAPVGSCQ